MHFKKLQAIFREREIPWENLHNADEIGMQLGGGRKGSGELYFFAAADRSRYLQQSDSLELITILESICGDGSASVKPCFVFAGVRMYEEWFEVDSEILVSTTKNDWTPETICA
ncbi:hypothetical protein BDW22DRAFT_1406244 [Trametopsis cervina]|nr:hypothetical protein BDW22DRAFT_1406244 [Trametopsis cervina]